MLGAVVPLSVPLSNWAKDHFVAPHMSEFTAADLPDMSETDPQQEHWLGHLILNNVLGPRRWLAPFYQRAFSMLRRSHAAFQEYDLARHATLAYLSNPDDIMRYLRAITHWEKFLADAWQCYDSFSGGEPLHYGKNDGSVLQRLHHLHNLAKHAHKAIAEGDALENGPLAIWLSNEGLNGVDKTLVTFVEIVEFLQDIAKLSDAMQNADGAADKLDAYARQNDRPAAD